MANSTFQPLTRSSFLCRLPVPRGTNATPLQCSTSERTRYLSQQRVSSLSTGRKPCDICSLSQEPQVPRLPISSPGEKKVTANTTRHVQLAGHTATLPGASVPAPDCVKSPDFELEAYKHVQHTCIVQLNVLLFSFHFSSLFAQ